MKLTGTYQITSWNESDLTQLSDSSKLTMAQVSQDYKGDIIGTSEVHYHMYYKSSSNAQFTAYEILKADISGELYTLVLKHNGTFENGIASSQFTVERSVPNSYLKHAKGTFIASKDGHVNYELSNN